MPERLIIGTRGSRLAIIQSELVATELRKLKPNLRVELKTIITKGDADKKTPIPLDTIGKAWFTAEIEQALADGEIDLAIHSLKDVPPETPAGLVHLPVLERADPRDILVSKTGAKLAGLPQGALIGTDSLRRAALLLHQRPDLRIESIRGNVDTRIRKLEVGPCDAIILAAAGLKRLGLGEKITEYLDPAVYVPAAGQGVLAAEISSSNQELMELIEQLGYPATLIAVTAEQAFIRIVDGGCKLPVGCYAKVNNGRVAISGVIGSEDARAAAVESIEGPATQAVELAQQLARRLRAGEVKA